MKTRSQTLHESISNTSKRYNILIYYKQLNSERIDFPMPMNFSWVGGGTDFTTGIKDWQIAGHTGLGNAVETLSEFCVNLVNFEIIKKDFRIEIFYY